MPRKNPPKRRLKAGQPAMYEDPTVMQKKIDHYFAECDADGQLYTIAGLSHSLGFSSRRSLTNYRRREKFFPTIEHARLRIECQRAVALVSGNTKNVRGIIFDLKNNFGWKPKKDYLVESKPDLDGLTEEQLCEELEAIQNRIAQI